MTDDKFLKDTRHHRRFNVEIMDIRGNVVAAREKDSSQNLFLPFKVKLLSLGGLLMQNKVRYNTGSELKMEMTLPENFLVRFTGKVTSCSLSKKSEAGSLRPASNSVACPSWPEIS